MDANLLVLSALQPSFYPATSQGLEQFLPGPNTTFSVNFPAHQATNACQVKQLCSKHLFLVSFCVAVFIHKNVAHVNGL